MLRKQRKERERKGGQHDSDEVGGVTQREVAQRKEKDRDRETER